MKIEGLDKLEKRLNQMERAAKELDGTHSVSFENLFTTSFMKKYTQFQSIEEFFSSSGFDVTSQEDFEAIPEKDLDAYVSNNTSFETWEDMFSKAMVGYAAKKLGF